MQTVSTAFNNRAQGDVRPISWQVRAAFTKTFDPSIDFFTLDQSLLDGPDLLMPTDNTTIAEWDKYEYMNLTDRVISVETTRELLQPYSIVQTIADITLNNYDNFFTPDGGSSIEDYILPARPFRILMGFNGETVPVFVGLSQGMPRIDRLERTVSFYCLDFLSWAFEKPVDDTVTIVGENTGYILEYLFGEMGLLPGQYVIDDTSFNTINYFYAEKGQTFGEIIRDLMQAEQGRLFMDELGIIRFVNRQNYATSPNYTFNISNTVNYQVSNDDEIINSVRIKSKVLGVAESQSLWQLAEPFMVPAGGEVEVWATFNDPVVDADLPTQEVAAIEASYYISDALLDQFYVFSKAAKMVFVNSTGSPLEVSDIVIWGEPVRVIDTILVEDADETSIEDFGESLYEFETNYIQDKDRAVSMAVIMVQDYKDYGSRVTIDVKGNPALQIGDLINVNLGTFNGEFVIYRITNIMQNGGFVQRLEVLEKEFVSYFILDQSLLDGPDVLMP